MTWTAPPVERGQPPNSGDERSQLDGWLDYHRQTLLAKCSGLKAEQLKTRSVEPSSLSLLGLVRHMTDVERAWFRRRFAGEEIDFVYAVDPMSDADFDEVDTADAEADLEAYRQEIATIRTTVDGRSLEETFFHPRHAVEMDLRWVYLHLIEEYARHNGHADLLRERIDGATGM
jgi:uncharacterized damage-inducible protein DinB